MGKSLNTDEIVHKIISNLEDFITILSIEVGDM